MIMVLDASTAAKLVLQTAPDSVVEAVSQAEAVIAPDLFIAEISNVFWTYHRFNNLPTSDCQFLIDKCIQLIDNFTSAEILYKGAFALAAQSGCTVYDSLYPVLARREDGILVTLDQQLARITEQNAIKVLKSIGK